MLYHVLRGTARVALRVYYADVKVEGHERIPRDGPVILVANHPNALVDAMLVATTVERTVFITARATLFRSRPLSIVLRRLGVIPLLRAQDVSSRENPSVFTPRNVASRAHVIEALRCSAAVLVFPEGISHDGPCMAPLKSGAARLALQAHESKVRNLQILPIGLIYEAKDQVSTTVFIRVGVPIDVDAWCLESPTRSPAALTREIARKLGQAALDPSAHDWTPHATGRANTFAAAQFRSALIHATAQDGLDNISIDTIDRAAQSLSHASPEACRRVETFVGAVSTLVEELESHGLTLEGHPVFDPALALRRLVRNVVMILLLAPIALLGHAWTAVLLYAARRVALWSLRDDVSGDQPAMRTILFALGLFPLWCGLLVAAGTLYVGVQYSLLLLALLSIASLVHACYRRRLMKAARHVAAYFRHGKQAAFSPALLSRVRTLRVEACALASELHRPAD